MKKQWLAKLGIKIKKDWFKDHHLEIKLVTVITVIDFDLIFGKCLLSIY